LILVITGTHKQGFDRLIKAVDNLAGEGKLKDVFIQTGYSSYRPMHCNWAKLVDSREFIGQIKRAELIISHGGAGSIAEARENKKKLILVPRLKKYNEHIDDRQLEIVAEMERSGSALAVYDIEKLEEAIMKAPAISVPGQSGDTQIIKLIKDFLLREAADKRKRHDREDT